ncbi:hypothetical protein MIR68_004203 [Amoeboaphelidium protococcarum]|nr:hypothetical protein MIR68_004203 [Amoeboaphelidium protococcarum]
MMTTSSGKGGSQKRQADISSYFGSADGKQVQSSQQSQDQEVSLKKQKINRLQDGDNDVVKSETDLDKAESAALARELKEGKFQVHAPSSPQQSQGKKQTAFSELSQTFEEIEGTSKRLAILEILTTFFVKVIRDNPKDLISVIYLCINRIGPTWEAAELGIGETVLIKAIASATGRPIPKIKAEMHSLGDLGSVAQQCRNNQPTMFQPKPLTVQTVFKTLTEISKITGHSSMQKKIDKIKFLLVSCRDNETKFIIRMLEGKLRIGLAEASVLTALAHASVLSRNSELKRQDLEGELSQAVEVVKQVYSEVPMYERIVPVLLESGHESLEDSCKLTPGIPLKPMLAHPTKAISEVLDRFDGVPFTCEYKYDGERAQIHLLSPGKVVIFSRNQENMSEKYPDIVAAMNKAPKADVSSFVIDSEAVAWDREKKQILPFQVLSTRKRKDVSAEDIKIQVCLFAFDLLYLNGQSLVRHSFAERRRMLYESFNEIEGEFTFAKHQDGNTIEDIQMFLDESVAGNCEGLMVKTVDENSSYEPSKRSRNWLKVKKDYLDGVGDSLDLVVVGAYHGKGKRTGGFGGFLLACFDPEREEYQTISKIATGFSEDDLAKHTTFFKDHVISDPKSYYTFGEGVKPDVWLEPVQVWEVKTADLSISPVYTAAKGLVDPAKGISLRFPRFVRIRDDKGPEQSTSPEQVADMYRNQKINHGFDAKKGGDDNIDEDY